MNYTSELDLANDGFVLTPNIWHTGTGNGKVFEKVVDNERVFYGVAPDGSVSKLDFTTVAGTVAASTVSAEAQPEAENPADEPAPEAQAE